MDEYATLRTKEYDITLVLKDLHIFPNEFSNKVALITGGARGFGKQLVLGLASLGATVYFIDKRETEALNTVAEATKKNLTVHFIHGDITHFQQMEVQINEIIKKHGSIDFLVNNAVDFVLKGIDEISREEWQYSHDTNTTAPMLFTKQVLPHMINNRFGLIINLIAIEGMAFASAMSSSKASCRSLLISLASEIAEHENVNVIGYAPGLMDTPLLFEHFPAYCKRLNYDFNDFVLNITNNPGYKGLIPVSHSAASLIWYMMRGRENHGLICTPYLPLHQANVIQIKENRSKQVTSNTGNINQANKYIIEVHKYHKVIENKIKIRTEQLVKEKTKTAELLDNLKEHSEELELLNEEKSNLLREIHHRVKNNMQVISSLLRIQSNFSQDNNNNELLEQSQNRIMAMATVHDILYRSNNFSQINFENYLKQLWHYLHKSMVQASRIIDFRIDTKGISLPLDTAISLGLVVNEILTNSLKHAFNEHQKASIYIYFDEPQIDGKYYFRIGDNGIGILTNAKSTGLGCELIHDLIKQVNGEVIRDDSQAQGTHYNIYFSTTKKQSLVETND